MADVRALLRQQRTARRIEHPHAAYSDAGKLLCTVCHEHVKTEALWEGHLRGAGHRQKLQLKSAASNRKENGPSMDGNTPSDSRNGSSSAGQSLKRKLDEDEIMADVDDQTAQEEGMRKKRSKPDMTLGDPSAMKRDDRVTPGSHHKPTTPPLTRRQSGTPTLGVEMQIPSRPATPGAMPQSAGSSAGGTSTATTPKTAGPFGRSPLIPHDPSTIATASQLPSKSTPGTSQPPAASAGHLPNGPLITTTVDEDEWAAFEADLVHGEGAKPKRIIDEGAAIISAPVMTAEELAAKSEEEERAKRRALADIQIEDDREEATRALETEFEVMEELEARARKLRERREALRLRNGGGGGGDAAKASAGSAVEGLESQNGNGKGDIVRAVALGKENVTAVQNGVQEDDEDYEDEDEDEGDDDWAGFRFRS